MASIKNILRHVALEIAKSKRRCHHKASHKITKGMVCLVVEDARGSRTNYCCECAKPMLKQAAYHLRDFALGLGITPDNVSIDGDLDDQEISAVSP